MSILKKLFRMETPADEPQGTSEEPEPAVEAELTAN